jgi:hypothetical protein
VASAEWLKRVVFGTVLSAIGLAAASASPLVVARVLRPGTLQLVLTLTAMGCGILLDLLGSQIMSQPEPLARSRRIWDDPTRQALRKCLRVFIVLAAILIVGCVLLVGGLILASGIFLIITVFPWRVVQLTYLRELVLRIPHARLAARAQRLQVAVIVAAGLLPLAFCAGGLDLFGAPSRILSIVLAAIALLMLVTASNMFQIALKLRAEANREQA